jgi:hypothetical protein
MLRRRQKGIRPAASLENCNVAVCCGYLLKLPLCPTTHRRMGCTTHNAPRIQSSIGKCNDRRIRLLLHRVERRCWRKYAVQLANGRKPVLWPTSELQRLARDLWHSFVAPTTESQVPISSAYDRPKTILAPVDDGVSLKSIPIQKPSAPSVVSSFDARRFDLSYQRDRRSNAARRYAARRLQC